MNELHVIISYLVSYWGYIEDFEIVLPEVGYIDLIASNISYILRFWSIL